MKRDDDPALLLDEAAQRDELVRRARDLQPLLRKNAAQTDRERRAAEENILAIESAGLFRIMQPRRYGGFGAPVRTHVAVAATLAEACPGTAWVQNLIGVCNWFASLLPARTQDEIFKDKPLARVAGVFTPSSQTHRKAVEGGLVVSGKWYYASGCLHADWGLVGLTEQDDSGKVIDQFIAYIPMHELTIEDTWHTVGMRGSGSACLVANDVFVPQHRMYSVPKILAWDYPTEFKGSEVCAAQAFVPVAALILAGPQLGMARAALDYVVAMAPKRAVTYTTYARQSDSTAFQIQVAEAAMKIDTAELHIHRACDEVQRHAEAGTFPDHKARARMRCDTAYGIRHSLEALNLLMAAHGSGGFAESSPMQRWWRDANTAAGHAVALPSVAIEIYGKALLGVDQMVTPLV
ncbi:MAG: oxidoreductase [Proteobacteria bacterium]|nr:oxidoreductase [Pseudomonadota bacterium]